MPVESRVVRGHIYQPTRLLTECDDPSSESYFEGSSSPILMASAFETFTVEEAVDHIGMGKFQFKLMGITGFAWMADAMEMMLLAIFSPTARCLWYLKPWQEAIITTVVFVGMMLSSSFWGWVCDKYGRKMGLLVSSCWVFYFGLLSAFVPDYKWILILRFLVGFGIGGSPQAVTLFAEFLPSKARGKLITLFEVFWAAGVCFCVILALVVMPTIGWRWLVGFLSVPALIFVLACKKLPESCRYLMSAGRREEALEILQRIAQENNSTLPEGVLVESSQEPSGGQFKDLLSYQHRKTTLLLWFIWMASAFIYYGIALMTTELMQNSGGNCAEGSGTDVCGCKMLTIPDYVDLLWTTLAEFPGVLMTLVLIEITGRKKTLAIEFAGASLFYWLLFVCSGRTMMTVFIFCVRIFIVGAFQAAYVYTPEVYPTRIRALAIGSCSGSARFGAMVTPFVAQVLLRTSIHASLSIYGIVCLACMVASLVLPIETKGRAMQEL